MDEDLAVLVAIMKRECAKSPMIKGTYYDAILMDVRMPVMAGIDDRKATPVFLNTTER